MEYLEAVARFGSIQAASRSLGIAASAIDRQIIALEEASKTPLFERHARGMRVTAAGEAAVLVAQRWRADQEKLEAELSEMRGMQYGTVRIAGMDSLSNSVLPELVRLIAETHPRIILAIDIVTPQEAAADLDRGMVDLIVAFNLPADRNRQVLWSAPLPFGCVVGPAHPLWNRESVTLADAARYPIAAQSRTLPVREALDRRHGWLFDPVEPTLVSNSLQLLKQALRSGRLLAITSRMDAVSELIAGDLRFVPIADHSLQAQSIGVVFDSRRVLHRATRIAADTLASIASEQLTRATELSS